MTLSPRALAAALVAIAAFGGCLGERASEAPAVAGGLLLPGSCQLWGQTPPCSQISEAGYVVEGLDLVHKTTDGPVGVRVEFLDRNLTLRDSNIAGFEWGITITGTRCHTCTLRLENVTLTGAGPARTDSSKGPWLEPTGIVGIQAPHSLIPRIVARNVTVQDFPSAVVLLTDSRTDEFADSAIDFEASEIGCIHDGLRLTARSVSFQGVAVRDCKGVGAYAGGFESLAVDSVILERNWQGLVSWGTRDSSSATVRGSLFRDNEVGGLLSGAGPLTLTDSAFTRNGAGPHPQTYAGLEADILHATLVGSGTIVMRGNCIQENPGWGAATTLEGSAEAADNWWGSATGPRPGGLVRGGFEHPAPLVPFGTGDLVSAGVQAFPFADSVLASCELLK